MIMSQPSEEGHPDSRCLVTMTQKAMDNFQERVTQYEKKIDLTWNNVQMVLERTSELKDIEQIKTRHSIICFAYAEYRLVCREYVAYLEGTRSEEGQKLFTAYRDKDIARDKQVNQSLSSLEEKTMQTELETKSRGSIRSVKSIGSRVSSTAIKAKAKAEAAKVSMEYAKKEAELLKKEAALREEERRCHLQDRKENAQIFKQI